VNKGVAMKNTFVAICLLIGGFVVFVLGSPYYSVFITNRNQLYLGILSAILLVVTIILNRLPSLTHYAPAVYAFFIASCATLFLNTGIFNIPYDGPDALIDIALDKIGQFLHIVPVIIILTLLAKDDLKSIFISKGDLRQGLVFGFISFAIFTILFIIQVVQFSPATWQLNSIVFIIIFIFANAIMEELWFRGIFLNKYVPLIGRIGAILVTSLVFGASHIKATYEFPGGGFVFGAVVFALGYAGADSMLKTDSLIGPVLFHAGYDLMIIISIINTSP
jgi:membrane protease YdiL (CAAX protease family)